MFSGDPSVLTCMPMYAHNVHAMTMKRVAHFLRLDQVKRLRKLSKETGIPVGELVRRAIDKFLETLKGEKP